MNGNEVDLTQEINGAITGIKEDGEKAFLRNQTKSGHLLIPKLQERLQRLEKYG